jgi:tol-pal system protein YbgF
VAERLYEQALADYQRGNYEGAVVNFKQVLRQAPTASQAGHAQYLIGESLYALQQYEAAIVAFDEVVQKYPQDVRVAAALLKMGYAFAELKDSRNAQFFLQQVQKRYPNSSEAQQATEKLRGHAARRAPERASEGASSNAPDCYVVTPRGITIVQRTPPDQGGRGYGIQQDFPGIASPAVLGLQIPQCP